jgi:hypothetical protein
MIEPGTVMIIASEDSLRPSDKAYDRRVAGVVAGAGGRRPAIILDRQLPTSGKVQVSIAGKVFCKVDACIPPSKLGTF